jgi:parallel beta-helix repeat protein
VSASPFGTIIKVCPGTYPEQVTITQPLTLEGVTDGTGDAAVITVPGGGLVQNATSSSDGPVAAQIYVNNTVGVTLNNLIIDGTGAGCPSGANFVFGILLENIGTSVDGTSAGKVENTVVRNEPFVCVHTDGIVSEGSYVSIFSNEVHDILITPIFVSGGRAAVTSNSTQNCLNGIVMIGTDPSSVVSGNTISNLISNLGFEPVGLWVTVSATVSKNTVTIGSIPAGAIGIYLTSAPGTVITGNKVNSVSYGLFLTGAAGTTVQSNLVSNVSRGITDQFSGGGNIVTKNTVTEATFGIFTDATVSGDTLVPNSFFDVVTTIDPSPLAIGTPQSD